MDDIVNQGWFALEVVWYKVRYEVAGNIVLIVVITAILMLLWIFLSPSIKNKGT